jgi:hypothetical protein
MGPEQHGKKNQVSVMMGRLNGTIYEKIMTKAK